MWDWMTSLGDWATSLGDSFSGAFNNLFNGADIASGMSNALPGTIESVLPASAINDYSNVVSNASSLMPGEWDWMKGGSLGGLKVPGLMDIGMGLAKNYVLGNMADNTRATGQAAARTADPFGPQRAAYQAKLAQLYNNPDAIKAVPGYLAGLNAGTDAIRRNNAKLGRLDSGNINYDLLDYSSKYAMDQFNKQAESLAGMAGAGINPSYAAQSLNSSNTEANKLASAGWLAMTSPWETANKKAQQQQAVDSYGNYF